MEKICLTKRFRFSSSHRLYINDLSDEENFSIFDKCSNKAGHGHNYVMDVTISGKIEDGSGMIFNRLEFDKFVNPLIEEVDHKWIDKEINYFYDKQSTVENLGIYLWNKLSEKFKEKLYCIKIWENPRSYFEYYKEN